MPFNRRRQKAVYWSFAGLDQYGNPTVNSAIELSVRWEYGIAQEIKPNTDPQAVDATVWVDREVPLGSMLRKGKLSELGAVDTPDKILEVIEYQEIPSVQATMFERIVLVRRFAETLPTVV